MQARGIEYVRHGDSGATGEDEDEDAYVVAHQVDLERWVRDLIAEALPVKIVCRDDCRGLCPVCGADLNADPDTSARGSVSGGRVVQCHVWLT